MQEGSAPSTDLSISSLLDELPSETILHILSFLSFEELEDVKTTNHRFHTIAQDSLLWRHFLRRDFPYLFQEPQVRALEDKKEKENDEGSMPLLEKESEQAENRSEEETKEPEKRLAVIKITNPKLTYLIERDWPTISLGNKYLILKEIVSSARPIRIDSTFLDRKSRFSKIEMQRKHVLPDEDNILLKASFLANIGNEISEKQLKEMLPLASKNGSIENLKRLLSCFERGNIKYMLRRSLEVSCEYGHLDLVKFLLIKHQADLYKDSLEYAALRGHWGIVDYLLYFKTNHPEKGRLPRFTDNTITDVIYSTRKMQNGIENKKKYADQYASFSKIVASLKNYLCSENPSETPSENEDIEINGLGDESNDFLRAPILSYFESKQSSRSEESTTSEASIVPKDNEPDKSPKVGNNKLVL